MINQQLNVSSNQIQILKRSIFNQQQSNQILLDYYDNERNTDQLAEFFYQIVINNQFNTRYGGKQDLIQFLSTFLLNQVGNQQIANIQFDINQQSKIDNLFVQRIQPNNQNQGYQALQIQLDQGQPNTIQLERINIIDPRVDDYISRYFRLEQVQIQQIALSNDDQVLESRLISALRYFVVRLLPRDIRAETRRNPVGFNLQVFLVYIVRNLRYDVAQFVLGIWNQIPPSVGAYSQRICTIDQQLRNIGASNNSFLIFYAMCCILFSDILEGNINRVIQFSLQSLQYFMTKIQRIQINAINRSAESIYKYNVVFGQFQNDRNDVQADGYLVRKINESYKGDVQNLNIPKIFLPLQSIKPIYEFSYIFRQDVQEQNIIEDSGKTVARNLDQLRSRFVDFNQAPDQIQQYNPQADLNFFNIRVSRAFNEAINNLYQNFYDTITRLQVEAQNQGQRKRLWRADLIFEFIITGDKGKESKWDSDFVDQRGYNDVIKDAVMNDVYFRTIRVAYRLIPQDNGDILSSLNFLESLKQEFMTIYLQQAYKYGNEEHNLEIMELADKLDFRGRFETIRLKPVVWFVRQDNQIQAQLTQQQYEGFNFYIPDQARFIQSNLNLVTQNKQLFGFLTYVEYLVDRIFVDQFFDDNRLIISKLIQNNSCGQQVLIYLASKYQQDQVEQLVNIFNGDEFDQDNQNLVMFQAAFEQNSKRVDRQMIELFALIFQIDQNIKIFSQDQKDQIDIATDDDRIFIFDSHIFIASSLLNYENLKKCLKFKNKRVQFVRDQINNHQPFKFQYIQDEQKDNYEMQPVDEDNIFKLQDKKKDGKFIHVDRAFTFKQAHMKANVFFDFETTYLEDDLMRANKLINKENAFDQVSFCVSYMRNVVFEVKKYVQMIRLISKELNEAFENSQFDNVIISDEKSKIIWQLHSEQKLIREIQMIEFRLQQQCQSFNEILIKSFEDNSEKRSGEEKERLIQKLMLKPTVFCISYNGAKFDNHFILRGFKQLYPLEWSQRVKIVGNFSNIKILQFENIVCYDLLLMTGAGCSLSSLAEAMKLPISKIDLKIEKVAPTFELANKNKKVIKKYCKRDTDLLYQIYEKFKDQLCEIVWLYCDNKYKQSDRVGEWIDKFNVFNDQDHDIFSRNDIVSRFFPMWPTISSLSLKLFKQFFLEHFVCGVSCKNAYQQFKNSYFGGFTQSFWVGENIPEERIRYLDFNSMYPSIMASLNFPVNFFYSNYKSIIGKPKMIQSMQDYIDFLNIKVAFKNEDFWKDPLHKNEQSGLFEFRYELRDYDLFTISFFEFEQSVFSPQIPVTTKNYGTIYPVQFDITEVTDLQDQIKNGIPIFGYKLRRLFALNQLKSVIIIGVTYVANQKLYPIFKDYDEFLYQTRIEIKKQNPVMAQCIKILLNSLYGKFGQSIFPINIIMNQNEYNDNDSFIDIILNRLSDDKSVDYQKIFKEGFQGNQKVEKDLLDMQIKTDKISDSIYGMQDHYLVTLENAPQQPNGSGGLVYLASLITDVGRSLINDVIRLGLGKQKYNNYEKDGVRVYYCDTDSVIINEKGYQNILQQKDILIDDKILGALKDEYPDQIIKEVRIVNKKVYQYKIQKPQFEKKIHQDGSEELVMVLCENNKPKLKSVWETRFKGVKSPPENFYDAVKNSGVFDIAQTKFAKKLGAVSIVKDLQMTVNQKLSRRIFEEDRSLQSYCGNDLESCQGNYTVPYQNIQQFYQSYSQKSGVKFNWEKLNWNIY